jgi:23S rRNA (guanosine2251-2'-O)-methyltransferase
MAHISPKESRNKKRQSKKSPQRAALNKELFIWGIHPILEALKTNPHHVKEIIVEKGKKGLRLEELLQVAKQKGISVITGQPALGGTDRKAAPSEQEKSQGVSARVTLPTLSLDKLLGKFENDATPPFLLALDSIHPAKGSKCIDYKHCY